MAGPISAGWLRMGLAPSRPMSGAVFLSYAREDTAAARRICEALRSGGVEVWFDQEGGLEHGDEWDAKIRRQIKGCVLFIPVISANTQSRHEGYFRIEWDLAAERAHGIASGVPFILPVVIDDTREPDALVPDRFRKVQWTRLTGGVVAPEVLARILKLWSHRPGVPSNEASQASETTVRGAPNPLTGSVESPRLKTYALIAAAVAIVGSGVGWWISHRVSSPESPHTSSPPAAPLPAPSAVEQLVARANALIAPLNCTRASLAAAEELTRQATDLAPDSAPAWAARAYVESCYLLRGWDLSEKRRQDTETFGNRALALNRNEPDAFLALAGMEYAQNAYAQEEAYARSGIALRSDDPHLFRQLGLALYMQGRHQEGLATLEAATRRFPRDPLTHYDLARLHMYSGNFDGALNSVDAALAVAMQPFPGALWFRAYFLAAWKGDLPAAQQALDTVSPMDRTEIRAVCLGMWLGLLERRLDRVQEAASLTPQTYLSDLFAEANGPKAMTMALALHVAGKDALARQQWLAAEGVLQQRLRDQTDDPRDSAYLAITLVWLGHLDEAAQKIAPFEATTREQQPSLLQIVQLTQLAQYYASLGDASKAVPIIRQVLNQRLALTDWTLNFDPWWDKVRGKPEFEALFAEAKERIRQRGK